MNDFALWLHQHFWKMNIRGLSEEERLQEAYEAGKENMRYDAVQAVQYEHEILGEGSVKCACNSVSAIEDLP